MKTLAFILAGLLLGLQYPLWIGKGSWTRVWELERMLAQQREGNAKLKARNDALDAEVRDLKEGMEAIEERARLELGMIRKDEVFYQIVPGARALTWTLRASRSSFRRTTSASSARRSRARARRRERTFEIVVCDDSPGSAIGDRVKAANDSRVRYVRNDPARGFEGNFTFALSEARGELVKFLNDDDRLRPDCVARLAAAFDDPRIRLATSRRVVIDAAGVQQPDMPATTPISHATCTIEGIEMGDLALVNGLNLIGEPTSVDVPAGRRGDRARGTLHVAAASPIAASRTWRCGCA